MTDRRVMVIQQGARRNYISARQLEDAGLLHSLVTDAAWSATDAGLVASFAKKFFSRRVIVEIDRQRIKTSWLPNLARLTKTIMHEEDAFRIMDEMLAVHNRLRGLQGVDVIVNYHGNGGSLLDDAKRKGALILTDFIITPKYLEIEQAERERWQGWEPRPISPSIIKRYNQRVSHLIKISDLYLCPSNTVADGLSDFASFDPARVRILPYGMSGAVKQSSQTVVGRILFAGAAGLRKGIPYLAEAASIIKSKRADIQVVVAGHVSEPIRRRRETRDLIFLGPLNREHMAAELAAADVFCLPSLAEGSATSIFEALSAGVPVVTTISSGSVVENGREGVIVPQRDGHALAQAIEKIVDDRNFREKLSIAALSTAAKYSDKACGDAFVATVKSVLGARR